MFPVLIVYGLGVALVGAFLVWTIRTLQSWGELRSEFGPTVLSLAIVLVVAVLWPLLLVLFVFLATEEDQRFED